MGIGSRHQVRVTKYTSTQDASGAWQETAVTMFDTWAEISNPSGFRAYQNGQTQLGETKDFLIRYNFDNHPGADWRLIYDGRNWTVTEVRKMEEKKFYYRLTATSKSNV